MLLVSKKDVAAAGFDLSFQTYKSPHEDGVARVRLDQLCNIRKGKSSSTKTETGPYPLYVTAEDAKSSKDFDFEGSGVAVPLISARGHGRAEVKRVHLVEGKFALANLLAFVEPKDEKVLNAKFLHYILSGSLNELANLMRGAANVGMSLGDLSGFKIPQPPITEQLQIVEELGGLESIIEETQKALSTRRSKLLREYLTQAQN
jgi:restriction endonuclease S subunit